MCKIVNNDPRSSCEQFPDVRVFPYWLPVMCQQPLLSISGVGIIRRDEVCCIEGAAKTFKSQLGWKLVAAAIGAPPEAALGIKTYNDGLKVLVVDTEMADSDIAACARRALIDANRDPERMCPELDIIIPTANTAPGKLKDTEDYIRRCTPDLVLIDGIVDLCSDFNDLQESASLVRNLTAIAKDIHCCIITILHTNPGTDKGRGHLGTILEQKCASGFLLERKGEIVCVSSASFHRHQPFPNFAVTYSAQFDSIILSNGFIPCEGRGMGPIQEKREAVMMYVRHNQGCTEQQVTDATCQFLLNDDRDSIRTALKYLVNNRCWLKLVDGKYYSADYTGI